MLLFGILEFFHVLEEINLLNNCCLQFSENVTCKAGYFPCAEGSQKCIESWWVCDGDAECSDGSDESPALCGKQGLLGYPEI